MMIGCKNRLIGYLAPLFFSIPAFSANGHVYLGGTLGASFANAGNNSPAISYFSGTTITDDYPLNSNNRASPVFSLNTGYEFTVANWRPTIALGLGVYTNLADYNYHGNVIETAEGDASSTLYSYAYNLNSTRLMGEIQINWMLNKLLPFINIGIGPSWNRMTAYNEQAVTGNGYPPLPPFQSRTGSNFAYQIGCGVSMALKTHTKSDSPEDRIAIGYRYVNLGSASFGTRGPVYPYALDAGSLQTNDVYLGYTHLF